MENALKAFTVIVVIIIMAAAISMLPQQTDNFVGQGSDVETATFIVYKDDNWTCVKNGTTNKIILRSENSTSIFQQTLDLSGGSIFITKGNYEMNYPVLVPSNVTIRGEGILSHVIWTVTTAAGFNLRNGAVNTTFDGLYVEGVGKDIGETSGIIGSMNSFITVQNCYFSAWSGDPVLFGGPYASNILITKNYFWDCDEGPELTGVSNSAITNNVVDSVTSQGIEIAEKQITILNPAPVPSSNILVANNIISNIPGRSGQTGWGLFIQGHNYAISIVNNVVYDAEYGFGTAAVGGRIVDGAIVSGNSFDSIEKSGIYIAYGKNFLLNGNLINSTGSTGIAIALSVQNVTIQNNLVHKTINAGAAGIEVAATVVNCIISGNTISYTKGVGIRVNCPNAMINSNMLLATGSYGFYINAASNSTLNGNVVRSATTIACYINNAKNVTVFGNALHSTNQGIQTAGTSDYNYIAFNNFKGCITPTYLAGSNNIVENNTGA